MTTTRHRLTTHRQLHLSQMIPSQKGNTTTSNIFSEDASGDALINIWFIEAGETDIEIIPAKTNNIDNC